MLTNGGKKNYLAAEGGEGKLWGNARKKWKALRIAAGEEKEEI